jgi:hypothetical protein
LLDTPSPQDLLSLLVASMEKPCVGIVAPILPQSVRVDDPAVFNLLRSELGQLGVEVELVERLSALSVFKEIAERELFSRQLGYSGAENWGQSSLVLPALFAAAVLPVLAAQGAYYIVGFVRRRIPEKSV